MPPNFLIEPQDVLGWVVVGLIGGLVGGMVIRGGAIRWKDALIGLPGALVGGVATEFLGLRGESRESVGSLAIAFFCALILTLLVRLMPGRLSESE